MLRLTVLAACLFLVCGFVFAQQSNYALEERIVKLEISESYSAGEVAMLRTLLSEERDTTNRIVGIGIGLSGLLMLLQVLQIVAAKRS